MSKLAKKLSRQILAIALSVAMILPNMTVYASEVAPDTQEKITVEDGELDEAQPLLTEEETDTDEVADTEEAEEAAEAPSYSEDEVSGSNADENGLADDSGKGGVVALALTGDEEDEEILSAVFYNKVGTNLNTYTGLEFTQFGDSITNGHGAYSSAANATIKFTLSGEETDKVDIDVLLCTHSNVKKDAARMTATADGESLTVLKETVGENDDPKYLVSDAAPKYTVFGVAGNSEVTLTFLDNGTYVHSIVATKRGVEKYSIEVESGANGEASVSPVYAAADATITLTAKPDAGYELDAWTVEEPTESKPTITKVEEDSNKATFTMPAANVKINASFKEAVGATYNVNVVNGYHGTAALKTGQGTGIAKDTEVTLADVVEVTPDEGYTFKEWYVTQFTTDGKIVDVTVTDGKFTMPAGNVDVMPVFTGALKDGYTYSFQGNKAARAQNAQLKDYGMITFEGFKDDDNDHGFVTDGQGENKAVMKLNLSDKATVVVKTCCYGTSTVTAKIGETVYTPAKADSEDDSKVVGDKTVYGDKYTITTDKAGELELTFDNNGAYIHSVTANYIQEGGDKKYVSTDGLSLDFMTLVKGHTVGEAVTSQANGLDDGVTITNFKWFDPDNNHGIVTNGSTGTIVLNLADGKRANIEVTVCQFSNQEMSTSSGEQSKDKSADPVYTILGAEGTVTLTFPHQIYLHNISAAYMADDEYLVKVVDSENGKASADAAYKKAGQTVTLTAEPDGGYGLADWQVIKPEGLQITKDATDPNKATFTMPSADVEVKAIFDMTGTSKTITVATNAEHGSAAAIGEEAITRISGVTVNTEEIATVTPDDGYELTGWTVTNTETGAVITDANVTKEAFGNYTFIMPGVNITITPVFEKAKTVAAGTHLFENKLPADLSKTLDGFTFDKTFNNGKNGHGILTNAADTKIILNLEDSANIEVKTCCYNAGTGAKISASSGKYSNDEFEEEPSKFGLRHTIKKADKGSFVLTIGTNVYIHSISVEYIAPEAPDVYTDGIDVWDFGAEQLQSTDTVTYNNKLTADIINSWYPQSVRDAVAAGGKKTDYTINSFEVNNEDGSVDFCFRDGGSSHRLRSDNPELIRYDGKTLTLNGTTYRGYIYDNKGKNKDIYVGVKLNAGDIMTAVVSSNGNNYTITVEDPDGGVQNFAREYNDNAKASLITYYAAKSGMYKIYNGTDEKLVVARVTRQHSKPVTVSGTVTVPEGTNASDFSLIFTCKESKTQYTTQIGAGGKYSITLFENYNYDVVVNPTTYVIEEGAELELGKANETQTATHDITVGAVLLRTLSGSIVGLGDDTAAKAAFKISFKKPEDKLYIPEISINKTDMTYTAQLEAGAEYTIITEGINDYEIDNTVINNSERIRINSDTTGRNITYTKKPVHAITIVPDGATANDLTAAVFTFTNLNEEGYVYDFTGTGNIALRDGTYSVKVTNSDIYTPKPIPNLVVDGEAASVPIRFSSEVVTKWDFTNAENYDLAGDTLNTSATVKNPCRGLSYEIKGEEASTGYWKYHSGNYGSSLKNIVISVPVSGSSGKVLVEVGYTWDIKSGDVEETVKTDTKRDPIEIPYTNANKVDITVGTDTTTYIKTIEVVEDVAYKAQLKVGANADGTVAGGYEFATINEALAAVTKMKRTASDAVTITIKPGNYEEMLVIKTPNIKLVNEAGANASIGLRNKGVDIDPTAVRITSYYGHGYSYYSMGNDCKWNEDTLAVNKANGYESYTNPGSGSTDGSYWNATVVIDTSNVSAEGIIFENSFNQYISKKAADDVIVKQSSAKEGAVPRASMAYGDTTVQQKEYVERAAALAITNQQSGITFDNCKFIGRQDTLYGGTDTKAAFYKCSIYGGTDYIMGAMIAVFAKCDLVFNTNDQTSNGIKNDVGYITAPQQAGGRGYLMWNCHVTSTVPGIDTASLHTSKPGYLGRPWTADTGEAVFYKTIVDEVDAYWQGNPTDLKNELKGKSLIAPAGWNDSLNGTTRSILCQERSTYEVSGVDNTDARKAVTWASFLETDKLKDGSDISVATFFGEWNPFVGKDIDIVLPDDAEHVTAPAEPTAIVTPELVIEGEGESAVEKIIEGASIALSAEAGAKIYYLVNPAEGAALNEQSTPYTGAIKVEGSNIKDNTITVKAIAVKYGKSSKAATFTYPVTAAPDTAEPELLPKAGDIKLGSRIKISAQAGAEIYYNVNSETDPTKETGTQYTGKDGIEITTALVKAADSTVTIKAIAILTGKPSTVASVTYNVLVNAPKANYKDGYQFPDGGGKVELTADEGVTIYYVTGANKDAVKDVDLTNETSGRKTYGNEGIIVSADTTIKAIANRGTKYSEPVTLSYTVPLNMPTATPESGSVLPEGSRKVKLTADEDATIYYVKGADENAVKDIDLTSADSGRIAYVKDTEIEITEDSKVIKAIAEKDGRYSVVALFKYLFAAVEFTKVKPLTATVNDSPVNNGAEKTVTRGDNVTVTLTSETPDVVIYYTLDGSAPNLSSDTYNASGIVISNISETTVIKAFAKKNGMLDSDAFTVTLKVSTQGGNDTPPEGEGLRIVFNDGKVYTYTGTAIKPSITVWNNDDKLVEGTDYTVRYTNNIKASVTKDSEGNWKPIFDNDKKWPTITVTGKGNLSGRTSETFTINPKNLEDAKDEMTAANAAELAEIKVNNVVVLPNRKAAPVLLYGGVKLAARDYEVTAVTGSTDNSKLANAKWAEGASDATMTFTAKKNGNFIGEATINVIVVSAAQQKAAKMKAVFKDGNAAKTQYYNAESHTPEIIVSNNDSANKMSSDAEDEGKKLNPGVDYVISYPADTINVGTKKVMITGTSANCIGTVTLTYSIKAAKKTDAALKAVLNPKDPANADGYDYVSTGVTLGDDLEVSYEYNGKPVDTTLVEGVDYKVTYSNNKKAGSTAAYVVTGLGNYRGLKTDKKFFTIKGLVLKNENKSEVSGEGIQLIVGDKIYTKKAVYKSVPSLIVNGELVKASEYTVKYRLDETAEWSTRLDKIELGEGENSKPVYVKIEPKPNKVNYIYEDGNELTASYNVVRTAKKDLSGARIALQDENGRAAKVAYTGNEVKPYKAVITIRGLDTITVILNGQNADYEAQGFKVTYANNVLKGRATVLVEATDGNAYFVGSKSATFNIVQKNLLTGLKEGEGFQQYVANIFKSLFDN